MAIIPGDMRFIGIAPSVDLKERKSAQINKQTEPYTMSDIVNTVSSGITGIVDGNGTANYISKWIDSDTISDSQIFDNGTNVGIGTATPATSLDVVGAISLNDGNKNTKVGTNAGANYGGTNQSAFGNYAGFSNAGGSQSAVGANAGRSNTGSNQSVFGLNAGQSNTGSLQSAVGAYAGQNNTGDNQSAVGAYAGFGNSGDFQSALGKDAGQNNTGNLQSAVGANAGFSNSGNFQSAVGASAGQNNTGANQSAFGNYAGLFNSGVNQSVFGLNAGRSNTGNNNSNFGYESGYYLSDGTTVNTGSSDSVFLGSSTKALGASQTNQIIIGHNTIGSGSNSVTIGNSSITKTVLRGDVSTDGSVQVGDDTSTATASNVGAIRYRTDVLGSYADMAMETASGVYAWVNIVTNLF